MKTKNLVRDRMGNRHLSRAFVKMVYLLEDAKILQKFKAQESVRTMSFCEMPGNFIYALRY